MDDVSNMYLKDKAPLSDEEFKRQVKAIEEGAVVEEQSPLQMNMELEPIAVTPDLEEDQPSDIWGYAKDIGSGAVTGWVNAGTEIAHTIGNVADMIVPFTEPNYFTNLANEYAPRLTDGDFASVGLKVPVTTAGKISETATQFITGFLPALKAMRVIGGIGKASKAGTAVKTMAGSGAAGVVADLSAFNPYEERISNWAANSGIPGLDNAVTEYLAADAEDGELEGRFKQALEGFFLGKAADAVFSTIRAYKRGKQTILEERGVAEPKLTRSAYITDPATGKRVVTDITNPDTGNYVDPVTGADISIPSFSVPEYRVPVRALPEEAREGLAIKLLDGDLDGAAQYAAGNVNLKYLDTEEGIKDLIEGLANERAVSVGKYKRSWEEAASKRGTDITTYTQKVAGLDTEVAKAEFARNTVAYKVKELANIFKASPSKETEVEFTQAFKKLNVLDAMVSQNKSEIARALAIMRRRSNVGQAVDDMMSKAKGAVGLDGTTNYAKLAQQIGDMPDSFGVVNLVKAYNLPNWKDAVTEVYINNLFSPLTLAKNLMSTSLSIGNSVVERYLGAARSQTVGSGDLTFREANTYALGLIKAIPEALGVMGKSFKTEVPQLSSTANEFQEQLKNASFTGEAFGITDESTPLVKLLGKGLDYVGIGLRSLPGGTRSLMATDEGMKTVVYRAELAALAQRQAFKEGLKPGTPEFAAKIVEIEKAVASKNPSDPYYGLSMTAMDAAHMRTFTEQLGEKGNELLGAIREFKSSYIVLPFLKTPINLVKYMFRRTPGLAGLSDYVETELKAGGARADLAQAQITAGAMYTAAGMALAGAGALQGDFTTNWTVNRNLKALGIQQRAMVLPDGTQVSIQGFDGSPMSMMLLAASTQETIEAFIRHNQDRMTDEELSRNILEISMIPVSAYIKYGMNSTWAQGVSALLNAYQEDTAPEYISSLIGNTVPAGNTLKYINQQSGMDPFAREIDDALDAVRAKLPQFSRDVAPRATLLGDPSEVPQYMALGLVPSYTMTPPDHPVYQELNRLQRLNPNEVVMGGLPRVVEGVELNGEEQWNMTQFMRYMKLDGKDLIEQLQEAMDSEGYQSPNTTDYMREQILSDIYNKRKQVAARALQRDSLAFHNGEDRPYAEKWRLYPYTRKSAIATNIANEKAILMKRKAGDFGEEGMTKEDFIKQQTDALIEENFVTETLQ